MQRGSSDAKVSDVPPIEVGETQESLDQLRAGWRGPLRDCTDHGRIHLNTIFRDDEPQE